MIGHQQPSAAVSSVRRRRATRSSSESDARACARACRSGLSASDAVPGAVQESALSEVSASSTLGVAEPRFCKPQVNGSSPFGGFLFSSVLFDARGCLRRTSSPVFSGPSYGASVLVLSGVGPSESGASVLAVKVRDPPAPGRITSLTPASETGWSDSSGASA
jgi:hypothetical protein